jgi:transcriptional regulator with PAS, ATPase and Fis domain
MKCMFDNNLTGLILSGKATDKQLKEAFEDIVIEYIDLAGLVDNEEIGLTKRIEQLRIRVTVIDTAIGLQKQSIRHFREPFVEGLPLLKKYGYSIAWNKDAEQFLKELSRIETREKVQQVYLLEAEKEVEQLKKNKSAKVSKDIRNPTKERQKFIDLLTTLPTAGYMIDKERTTVEELASMIRQYNEASRQREQVAHQKAKAF